MIDLDWGEIYRKLAEAYHWTPSIVRDELTCHDLEILVFGKTTSKTVVLSAEEQLERRNQRRARKGLPPIEPRKRR